MAGSSAQQQQHPDWEWAFIPDITNVLEMEEELSDPCSWSLLAKNKPACFVETNSFGVRLVVDETCLSLGIAPRPFRNSMWCSGVVVDKPRHWFASVRAAVLVREIPLPLVLTCCLSETALATNMTFITLAGNEVGQKSYPKDCYYLMWAGDIIDFAYDVAYEQDLLTSANQKLRIVLEGLPRLIEDSTVLKSEDFPDWQGPYQPP